MLNFRNFEFWKRSKALAIVLYKLTSEFPQSEQYGLTNQIRRAAVSIPSNIAEGASRSTRKDFSRFLEMSLGSAHELETQLEIAYEIGYINRAEFNKSSAEINEIIKMVSSYRSKLSNPV